MPERRKYIRVDARFVVSYKEAFKDTPRTDITQTKNISFGGMLFTTDREFKTGTILKVKIRLPNIDDYINVKVEVVDSRSIMNGMMYDTRGKFIGIRPDEQESIKNLIDNYPKKGKG